MENSNNSNFHGRPAGRPNGSRPDNRQRRPKDRQKGMVAAFVQGKGQNAALKWLMDSKTPVCIFLSTGVKFEGVINAFDAFTISIVDVKHHQQMVYKDKISTITVKRSEGPSNGGARRFNPHFNNSSDAEHGVSRPSFSRGPSKTSDDGVTLPPSNLHSTY